MPNEVEQRLKAIEERVSKASPPPWFYHPMRGAVYSKGTPILAVVEDVNPAFKTEFADLMFVENARDDVPWLLSLLREREEEIKTLSALFDESQEENKRLRHLLDEIERGTDDIREGLHGCGDNSCIVKRPMGMATNGGCRCVARNWFEGQVIIGRALRKAARLEEENRRLREAAQALVQVLDGRLEPLHPISWLQPLEALKSTLRGSVDCGS